MERVRRWLSGDRKDAKKKQEMREIRSAGKLWRAGGEKLQVEKEVKRENIWCIFASVDVDLSCSFSHTAYQAGKQPL